MSGGGFNYLQSKGADELLTSSSLEDLQHMVNELQSHGEDGKKAAEGTRAVIAKIQSIKKQMEELEAMTSSMYPVWRAMDYWHALDIGKDQAMKVLNEYSK